MKEKKETRKDGNQFTIEGLSALSEFVKFRPDRIRQIFCKQSAEGKVRRLLSDCSQQKLPLQVLNEMDKRDRGPVSALVEVHVVDFQTAQQRFQKRAGADLVLALDHIVDPRNLGAIVRSAAFFGVREVIVPRTRQVLLTEASVGTSQGAFALTDLVLVPNLVRALEILKDFGYWILAADGEGEAFQKNVGMFDKVVLVLGAEQDGVSALVKKKADKLIGITGAKRSVESLNVSVAAGILLHSFSHSTVS
ncbi:MAG: RNA methyltransferase [Deltaproteobacteria bacterium]|nr:RNA methyltransferase [Deltaproteobacteria bacterium]